MAWTLMTDTQYYKTICRNVPIFFLGAGQKLTRSYKGSRTTVETDLPLEKHYQKK